MTAKSPSDRERHLPEEHSEALHSLRRCVQAVVIVIMLSPKYTLAQVAFLLSGILGFL